MICMSRRRRRNSEPLARENVCAVEDDAPDVGLDEAEDEASEGALAGAGFAHQTERFTGLNVERDVVDGADFSSFVASRSAERGFGEIEDLGQVADFDEAHAGESNSRRW